MNKEIEILGVMTGTSADGVDMSSITFDRNQNIKNINNHFVNFDTSISNKIKKQFGNKHFNNEYKKFITDLNIDAIEKYIQKFNDDFEYICIHGQTIYHDENEKLSIQVIDEKKISNHFNKKVIFDLRKKDLLNGGNGAPIVPIFHKKIFPNNSLIINIGGVANATYIDDENIFASDIGIGNALMDDYITHINHNEKYDRDGNIAKAGETNLKLFNFLTNHDFFNIQFPKSIDRNLFKQDFNSEIYDNISQNDVLKTLLEFTIFGITKTIEILNIEPKNIIICGGGSKNLFLMEIIQHKLSFANVVSSDIFGFDTNFIESQAFSYLGLLNILNIPATFTSTTGVNSPTVLGYVVEPLAV